jgi:hypothetical protein
MSKIPPLTGACTLDTLEFENLRPTNLLSIDINPPVSAYI